MMMFEGKRVICMSWQDSEFGVLLSQSALIARGWTKARIRKEIGEPDCYGLNPRGGSYVLLYSEARTRRVKFKVIKGEAAE